MKVILLRVSNGTMFIAGAIAGGIGLAFALAALGILHVAIH